MVTPLPSPSHLHQLTPNQPFIFGINFLESALVTRSLKSYYGLGPQACTSLMSKFHIHATARIGNLGEKQINSLAAELAEMQLGSDLRGQLQNNIKRLRDMGTYRGRRHAMGLPVRGQRTRTQVSFVCGLGYGLLGLWLTGHGRL
jgi:small subunit ribosomal protein S13